LDCLLLILSLLSLLCKLDMDALVWSWSKICLALRRLPNSIKGILSSSSEISISLLYLFAILAKGVPWWKVRSWFRWEIRKRQFHVSWSSQRLPYVSVTYQILSYSS
jgi:hypothetical protein